MAFNTNSLSKYIKSKFTNQTTDEQLNLIAERFIQLFIDHGIEKSQIPRIFPTITLSDLVSNTTLIEKLTPTLIDEVAQLFNVRSEWLEGVDEVIYPYFSCYKQPEKLFKLLNEIDISFDDYPIRILTSATKLDYLSSQYQPIILVIQKKFADLNDEDINRYYIDTVWDWSHEPCRIQLKAIAYQFFQQTKIPIPIYQINDGSLKQIGDLKAIPRNSLERCVITDPSLEDFVVSNSPVTKEIEELPKVISYCKEHKLDEFVISSNRKLHQVDVSPEKVGEPITGEQSISDMARKNANKRYERLKVLKEQFQLFYENCQHTNKSKAARDYFESLDFSDQIQIVPTYDKGNHKDSLKKAVRNLTSSLQ